MATKNPDRNDIARFDVTGGPLIEIYTLAEHAGTRVSVMGGPMTGVYVFDEALDAMAWVLVETGWEGALGRTDRYLQFQVPDNATQVKGLMAVFNYERGELAKLTTSDFYRLKITSSGGETHWLNIDQAKLDAISEILIYGVPDVGAIVERAREEAIRDYMGPGT